MREKIYEIILDVVEHLGVEIEATPEVYAGAVTDEIMEIVQDSISGQKDNTEIEKLLEKINDIAIEYDHYHYRLPICYEVENSKMINIVKLWLNAR